MTRALWDGRWVKKIPDFLAAVFVSIFFLVFFGVLFFVFVAMIWETWSDSPEKQKRISEWEARDDIPEHIKAEMRAKYDLMQWHEQDAARHEYEMKFRKEED